MVPWTLCLISDIFLKILLIVVFILIAYSMFRLFMLCLYDCAESLKHSNEDEFQDTTPVAYQFEDDKKEEEVLTDETDVTYCKLHHNAFFERCVNTIKENIADENYNVTKLAYDLNLERSVMYKKLKLYTNFTPAQLIERVRVESAVDMLQNSNLSFQVIALECGFKGEKAMKESFKKNKYYTPDSYRTEFQPTITEERDCS